MGLRRLLTNLSEGIKEYPNHNIPATGGGFNHGSSTTRIFDNLPFRQKSYVFGQGTAYDRQYGQFSSEPFIRNPIVEALRNNPSIDDLPGDLNSGVPNSLIRGGAVPHLNRLEEDFNRITNFLITPQGLAFTAKQVGLQRSNPRIDKPSNSVESSGGGILGFLSNAGSSLVGSIANQRTYNLKGNLLAQVLGSGTGVHIKREGALPTATGGYKDADGTGLLGGPNLFEDGPNNRLIYLLQDKIYTSTGADLTDNSNQTGIGKFLSGANKFLKKAGEFLGNKNNDLGTLYSYSGGPESVYGIGRTTIRRYTSTNKDSLPRIGDDSQFDTPLLTNSPNIGNYLLKSGKLGFNYTKSTDDGSSRYFTREQRINTGNPGVGVGRDNERSDSHIQQKNDDGTLNYNVYNRNRIDKLNALDVFRSKGDANLPQVRDLIRFRFEAVDSDNPDFSDMIVFRAFLDSFNDNYNASHNEFNYNGRGETFYTYNSFKRNISLSFKIAAQSRVEMMPLYRKLNYLVSNVAPEYGPSGRIRTPFMKLTVGSWCDRVPGILNSVN